MPSVFKMPKVLLVIGCLLAATISACQRDEHLHHEHHKSEMASHEGITVVDQKIVVENVEVRLPIPGRSVTSGYLQIANGYEHPVELVGISSKVAEKIEMHTLFTENDMMKMRQVEVVTIPAHSIFTFKSGGEHLMLFGVDQGLHEQSDVELVLNFNGHSPISVKATLSSRNKPVHQH